MSLPLLVVLAVVVLVVVSVFSRRLGVAAPVLLVVVGIGISLLPGTPKIVVAPSLILELVLPPLLYSAAVRVPVVELRRNLRAISLLSVVLVVASSFAVGALLWRLLPTLSFGGALALGAVVSPTDAVAATAIAKRLGLPARLVTLLEGESLVNDASALVLLKVAIGATGAAITIGGIIGPLAYAVFVAIGLGLLLGRAIVRFRARFTDPVLDSVISFAAPFIAYVPVEALGASGVLSVVTVGMYSGHASVSMISARARLTERINWATIQFVLENGVFLLMGLQLKTLLQGGTHDGVDLLDGALLGLLISAALLVVRALFVAPLIWAQRNQAKDVDRMGERVEQLLVWVRGLPEQVTGKRRVSRRDRAERILQRRSGDITDLRRDTLDWRSGFVATWAGMRGVVTLAAAQSLPTTGFPYRTELIIVAFVVALVTLLVQGGTLPWLIRLTGVQGTDRAADDRELASLLDELYEAGMQALQDPGIPLPEGETVDPDVVDRLKSELDDVRGRVWERVDENEGSLDHIGPHRQYRMLLGRVLSEQREALLEARSRGDYASRVLGRAQRALDAEESRLAPLDGE